MYFVQYFQPSCINPAKLIEACGDRAVIILDGRNSSQTMLDIAESFGRQRKYNAYQIYKGESFTRAKPMSAVIGIN